MTPAEVRYCTALMMSAKERAAPLIQQILDRTDVTSGELCSDIRTARISNVRQLIMAALHDRGFTTTEIGALLGRDHTTVCHGIRAAKARAAKMEIR